MSTIANLGRPAEILLAEDNEDDVELLRIGLRRSRLAINLHRVQDGEECMNFLLRKGRFAEAPEPDLLLLDLNMPRMDGREVMAAIAGEPRLWRVPVVILTTSDAEADVFSALKLRFNSYIVKPIDFQQFARVVQSITDYWFTVVVVPPERKNNPPA
jgi:two-component system response regulator